MRRSSQVTGNQALATWLAGKNRGRLLLVGKIGVILPTCMDDFSSPA